MDSEFKDYKSELLAELPAFREVSEAFLNGGLSKAEYKGKSGGFGVYAQRDKKSFMIRLRISAGVLSMEQLGFIYRSASEAGTDFVHLTTRGAVQIHNLNLNQVMRIMEEGIGLEIFTRGGGGNFPRNVANSPTGGFMKDDAFDVSEYAVLTDKHFYKDMTSYKLPRKFKVSYSSNAGAEAHSTVQEVGFIAKIIDGERKFDVYIGGGLGNHPRTAFLYEENIEPKEALYYVDAMLELFKEHGNYEDKSRARIH